MSESINAQIAESIESHHKVIRSAQDLYAHAARIEPLLKTLRRFRDVSTMVLGNQISVRLKVDKIAEADTVLEYLQDELGVEFDKSNDFAEYSWRTFECKNAKWLRVDAELKADGPECRRVIVGYETVPKYELKCGEDAAMPDAPAPGSAA